MTGTAVRSGDEQFTRRPRIRGIFFTASLSLTLVLHSPFKKTPEYNQVVNCNRNDHIDRNYQQQIDWYDWFWVVHRRDPSAARHPACSQMTADANSAS